MKNDNMFIHRLSLRPTPQNAFRRILRKMLLSIAKQSCGPASQANKRTQAGRDSRR